jgi:hypothetical protein
MRHAFGPLQKERKTRKESKFFSGIPAENVAALLKRLFRSGNPLPTKYSRADQNYQNHRKFERLTGDTDPGGAKGGFANASPHVNRC